VEFENKPKVSLARKIILRYTDMQTVSIKSFHSYLFLKELTQ